MRWFKKGRIFNVSKNFGWMNSHAQIPTVLVLDDRLRIYFATRPRPKESLTSFIDVDIQDPSKVLYIHDKPILELGRPGMFDEHGIMPSCVCREQDQVWLYYGGWSRRTSIPYSNWTGLAVSEDGGNTFRKAYPGPIIDRTPQETLSATAAFVLKMQDKWHMWYASGIDWIEVAGKHEEHYVIKHGQSSDGITWLRDGRKLLPSRRKYEPVHRPSVIELNGSYHMWFCHRGIEDFRDGTSSYRIGYAHSRDLRQWERRDDLAGIEPSEEGWDSKMIAYPYVVRTSDCVLLFYNGNGFGTSGFGYAVLEQNES